MGSNSTSPSSLSSYSCFWAVSSNRFATAPTPVSYTHLFKSQQSGRNSILLPLKNEPLLMLILNFIPLAVGYLLKCYKFHKQGFGAVSYTHLDVYKRQTPSNSGQRL